MLTEAPSEWQQTACILCESNCGIEVKVDDRHIARVRGDKAHPLSKGYTCEKAFRLDHYQNARDRLTSPLRRRPDGTFEKISWETAINEIAQRLLEIRDAHGADRMLYYGGGGQGNHLGGAHSIGWRNYLGMKWWSNGLAQEKTGEYWVDGKLFGNQTCHTTPDFEKADVVVFVGKNVWHSHGPPAARVLLKEIARDPERKMVVIDPRRTETADLADIHLQVRPGTDAFLLMALLAIIVERGWVDSEFLDQRTTGFAAVLDVIKSVPVEEFAARSGVPLAQVEEVARLIGTADSVAIHEDLGIQQSIHSTLNSYLEKLLYLITGNFGVDGGIVLHTWIQSIYQNSPDGDDAPRTPVTGERVIGGLIPVNAIASEISTDSPNSFKAMVVESTNPLISFAETNAARKSFESLDLLVVIDVAMTETARIANYVLPASSQFEKWECTFFTFHHPRNAFHLRAPVIEPLEGTLPEPEIHTRLLRALGAFDGIDDEVADLRAIADEDLEGFVPAFFAKAGADPRLMRAITGVLYETLGQALPDGAAGAAILLPIIQMAANRHGDAIRRAGFEGAGPELGVNLFREILAGRSGVVFSESLAEESWNLVMNRERKIHLEIPELLDSVRQLANEPVEDRSEFPLTLSAGERRSSNASAIYRDPSWRKKDVEGALRVSPADANALGITDGSNVRVVSPAGHLEVRVEISDSLLPGHVTLPNGFGMRYGDSRDELTGSEAEAVGPAVNQLTWSEHRDPIAGTPYHKYVPVRVEPLEDASIARG